MPGRGSVFLLTNKDATLVPRRSGCRVRGEDKRGGSRPSDQAEVRRVLRRVQSKLVQRRSFMAWGEVSLRGLNVIEPGEEAPSTVLTALERLEVLARKA